MSLLEKLASIARVSVIEESGSDGSYSDTLIPDAMETRTVIFSQKMVDLMHSRRLHGCMSASVRQSWVKYPSPPVGFEATDIVVFLLCSHGYTFNRASFPWSDSVELTFQRLWRMAERLCRMSSYSEVLWPLVRDRTSYGYSLARGIDVYAPDSEDVCLDNTCPMMIKDLLDSLVNEGEERPRTLGKPYCVHGLVSAMSLTLESFFH